MKPRLPVAPLTKEDGDVWVRVINRSRRCFSAHDAGLYHRVTLGADRRDADLMLELMRGHKTFHESLKAYRRLRQYALSIGGAKRDWPE